ncbi:MAG: hypothetical protein HKP29_01630, partial [Silicimonas sp.]|nr:hypothetical protein [Silicimonas sp.]
MKLSAPQHAQPDDADRRRAVAPVICYPPETLPSVDTERYREIRGGADKVEEIVVSPRDAGCIDVRAGMFFRIVSVDGPQ